MKVWEVSSSNVKCWIRSGWPTQFVVIGHVLAKSAELDLRRPDRGFSAGRCQLVLGHSSRPEVNFKPHIPSEGFFP